MVVSVYTPPSSRFIHPLVTVYTPPGNGSYTPSLEGGHGLYTPLLGLRLIFGAKRLYQKNPAKSDQT